MLASKPRRRPSPALVISLLALFVALGGSAYAAGQLAKNSVGAKQLKKNAVTAAKIKKNAITTAKIQNGAITGSKVDAATLGTVPSATNAATAATFAGYSRKGIVRATASPSGASEAASAAASPEIVLFSAGPLTIYAKCYEYSSTVYGRTYIRTTENGVIFDSDEDSREGEPFLDVGTPEDQRQLPYESVGANDSSYWGVHSPEFTAMAPGGTAIRGDLQIAVKNGNLPGGNGVYGAGNVCLFAGEMTVLNS